jgi:serine/threonine-protein kinase
MGEVYLAEHPRLPRHDALKVLPADVSADPEFRNRFNREADLAATLFHPHIVGVHDRGEFEGQLWIAMDYVEGTDAGQLMKARYPDGMPEFHVCAIVTAVAAALDYANQRGLLHRDVKPANILLTEQEDGERRIMLTNFETTQHRRSSATGGQSWRTSIRCCQQRWPKTPVTGSTAPASSPPNSVSVPISTQKVSAAPRRASRSRQLGQGHRHKSLLPGRIENPPSKVRHRMMSHHRRRRRRLILVGAAAVVVIAAISATIYTVERKSNTAASSAPAAPPLDGTYRVDLDRTKQTVMGAPLAPDPPDPPGADTSWWAYRSSCTSKGCVATGTALDEHNHQQALTPPLTAQFHFVDGHWHRTPSQFQESYDHCLSADGKSAVKGEDTEQATWSAEPQPDGMIRGVHTDTALTNECGLAGVVRQSPIVLTRVGDVPPTVTVADPATVTPSSSTPAPVPGCASA